MKSVVWKYGLTEGHNTIRMPAGAKILGAHAQHGRAAIWALVSKDEPMTEPRSFLVLLTGQETSSPLGEFIGSVLFNDGTYVLHVFEVGKP